MPEGDTIAKLARALAPMLVGHRLHRVVLRTLEAPELEGCLVDSVDSVGKHLLIGLEAREGRDAPLLLRTHLGLHGSWHQYPPGAAWRRPAWQASVVLETASRTFVCFNAKDVACFPASRRRLHRALDRLGPDLLADPVDLDTVLDRLSRCSPAEPIANVLLDQSVACGIGNVFKSEVLFLAEEHPQQPLGGIDPPRRRTIYRLARDLLVANSARAIRTTTGAPPGDRRSPRLWVYARAGLACLRCEGTIRFSRMGIQRRSTYWCPRCQAPRRDAVSSTLSPG